MNEYEYLNEIKNKLINQRNQLTVVLKDLLARMKVVESKKQRCSSCGAKLDEYFELNGIKLCSRCYEKMKPMNWNEEMRKRRNK